jgi:hypothetical protein
VGRPGKGIFVSRHSLWLPLAGLLFAAPASATLIVGSVANNSRCVTADTDNAASTGSNSIAYVGNENHSLCLESGTVVDNNGVRIGQTITGSGSSSVAIRTFAGVAVDSIITSDEYSRAEIRFTVPVTVDVVGSNGWQLDVTQSILGILKIIGESGGQANAGANVGVGTAELTVSGTPYNVTMVNQSLSGSSTTSLVFSGNRFDSIFGFGDTALSLVIHMDLDAFSDSTSIFNNGDEAAALMGFGDFIGDALFSATTVDNYGARNAALDGYFINLGLTEFLPEPGALGLAGIGLAAVLGLRGRRSS